MIQSNWNWGFTGKNIYNITSNILRWVKLMIYEIKYFSSVLQIKKRVKASF